MLFYLLMLAWPFILVGTFIFVYKTKQKDLNELKEMSFVRFVFELNKRTWIKASPFAVVAVVANLLFKIKLANNPEYCYENWFCGSLEVGPFILLATVAVLTVVIKLIITFFRFYKIRKQK